ncbi:hypothetical protein GFL58_30970 [Rhizobium leguminosarum bv. viciae]|uniref:hypothetical protein n=1 Tax=Rhizobium leguminosarum TaxID=384 RepID=UPI00143F793E|nr:hypothetical protein [Rhizobium leguminosarum]NKM65341.1 hypothetical protein [Rhizobium leguminosarum bv. viciae]
MLPEGFVRETFITGLRQKHARILPQDIAFSVENGWLPLIAESLDQIEHALDRHGWIAKASVRQIKEKLGDLRIYVRPRRESASFPKALSAELAVIRDRYTKKSVETCEICGDHGELGNFDGYQQTLCPRHADQRRAWVAGGRKGDLFND